MNEKELMRCGLHPTQAGWTQEKWNSQKDGDWMNPQPELSAEEWQTRIDELNNLPLIGS